MGIKGIVSCAPLGLDPIGASGKRRVGVGGWTIAMIYSAAFHLGVLAPRVATTLGILGSVLSFTGPLSHPLPTPVSICTPPKGFVGNIVLYGIFSTVIITVVDSFQVEAAIRAIKDNDITLKTLIRGHYTTSGLFRSKMANPRLCSTVSERINFSLQFHARPTPIARPGKANHMMTRRCRVFRTRCPYAVVSSSWSRAMLVSSSVRSLHGPRASIGESIPCVF